MIQVPFFLTAGFAFACQKSLYRFWGWTENAREVKMFETMEKQESKVTGWSVSDW
jgi:hypothetical protein